MRLDRYSGNTTGKFSIIENNKGGKITHIGDPEDDFIVLKFKDRNTLAALVAYANAVYKDGDIEYFNDLIKLIKYVGNFPIKKSPD